MLEGIERAYCDACIRALIDANETLMDTRVDEATSRSHVWRKGDTLGLDHIPENAIGRAMKEFDSNIIIVSEEVGEYSNPLVDEGIDTVYGARTFCCCDPFDRSRQGRMFIKDNTKPNQRVGDLFLGNPHVIDLWEQSYGKPASITGASAAITCVRRGTPIGSVMLNFVTQQIFLACRAGFFYLNLDQDPQRTISTDFMLLNGNRIEFPTTPRESSRRIVAFLGKPERGYPQNFSAIDLVNNEDLDECMHERECGGPLRILYLSSLHPTTEAVGVVIANGEKIGEWIHWLTFSSFARRPDDPSTPALRVFEVAQDQSFMRDGYLLMPSPAYSAFKDITARRVVFDVERLRGLDNPSRYRATLILTHATNKWAISRIQQYSYREIVF